MKRLLLTGTAAAILATPVIAGEIDPDLRRIILKTSDNEVLSTLVFLNDQVNIAQMNAAMNQAKVNLRERHRLVVTSLQEKAGLTQGDLIAHLTDLKDAGRISDFHPYWLSNAIRVDATRGEIVQLAGRQDVLRVYFNYPIETVAPMGAPVAVEQGGNGGLDNPEPGLVAIRAPEVWTEFGVMGNGVLTSTLDTGVDGNHPALASRWAGVADSRYAGHPEWAWFDPVTNTTFPTAFGSHGTHTMGTVCGGAPGDEIGVAPGATWIHAAVIDRVSIQRTVADALLAFEWLVDPDGDPNTNWDVPAVCSNSWRLVTGHGYPPCDETFWTHLDACEAAGTLITFSAGNEGFSGLGRPSDRATDEYRTFSVAAVDANQQGWPIASFSSRGPTNCTPNGQPAIKPDISGPGVNVRSALPGNSYGNLSGTSMASPHINGVVCLMREVNPDLSVDDIKQIMYDTAFDLGDPGEDNNYGYGMVDAYEAVVAAISGDIPMRLRAASWTAGVETDLEVFRATPGSNVAFIYSIQGTGSTYVPQLDVTVDLASPRLAGIETADQDGYALHHMLVPFGSEGTHVWMQAAEFQRKSNVVDQPVEYRLTLEVSRWLAGVRGDAEVFGATPGATVAFLASFDGTGSTFIPQFNVTVDLLNPVTAGTRVADQNGYALLRQLIPTELQGRHVWMQAVEQRSKSNLVEQDIE